VVETGVTPLMDVGIAGCGGGQIGAGSFRHRSSPSARRPPHSPKRPERTSSNLAPAPSRAPSSGALRRRDPDRTASRTTAHT
jgi:hypothetical protein